MYPINVVEKETGINKYLLRMWERRYSFPKPKRDHKGERVFSDDDIEKLKLIKKLMKEGYRPSKIMGLDKAELSSLLGNLSTNDEKNSPHLIVLINDPALRESTEKLLHASYGESKFVSISSPDDLQALQP